MGPLTQWLFFPRALRRREAAAEGASVSEKRVSEAERAHAHAHRRSVDGSLHSSSRTTSSGAPRRRSVDLSVLKGYARHAAAAATDAQMKKKGEQKKCMVKRRTKISVHFVHNPMLSTTEFLVDARYKHLALIGAGRYGVVVRALDTKTGRRVAIKKVCAPFSHSRTTRDVLRELRLLRLLRHDNIVGLLDVDIPASYRDWDAVYLVTPLLSMDLRAALKKGLIRDMLTKKKILVQILRALAHMHAHNVLHRDVKSMNVLVDGDFNAKICDLGSARFYSRLREQVAGMEEEEEEGEEEACEGFGKERELTVGPRTPLSSAPELFLRERYSAAVDLWGVGCIAAELLAPEHDYLFNDKRSRNALQSVVNVMGVPTEEDMKHLKKKTSLFHMELVRSRARSMHVGGSDDMMMLRLRLGGDCVEEEAVQFVQRLLQFHPDKRMTAAQALRHPFLKDVVAQMEEHDVALGKRESACEDVSFENAEPPQHASRNRLKKLVWQEVVAVHPEAASIR